MLASPLPTLRTVHGQAAHRVCLFRLRRRCAAMGGQCPSCGEWNTLASFTESRATRARDRAGRGRRAREADRARSLASEETRLSTGFAEFDRVHRRRDRARIRNPDRRRSRHRQVDTTAAMRGGAVKGTRACCMRPARSRCARSPTARGGSRSMPEASRSSRRPAVERILALSASRGARIVVIDSIQTMSVADVEAAPGAVTQLRESTAALVRHAKATGTRCC